MNWKLVVMSPRVFFQLKSRLEHLHLTIDQMTLLQKSNADILLIDRIREEGSREVLFSPYSFEYLSTIVHELYELDPIEISFAELTGNFSKLGFHFLYGNENYFKRLSNV